MTWDGLTPPYATIVVDPPWHYAKVNPDSGQEGDPHRRRGLRPEGYQGGGLAYSSMTVEEVTALRVGDLAASDARVFLWTTNRYLRHSWGVLEAWGFEPQDRVLVWCKQPRGSTPVTTEFILIGKRGKPPRMPWHPTTWFNWPLQPLHSQKPPAMLDLVESWCPGPYVEVFARQPRLGWDSWGWGYEGATA